MFKAIISNSAEITAGENVPLSVVMNTNRKTAYNKDDDTVIIREPGYYDVIFQMTLTDASASPLYLQLYANDTLIKEVTADITTSTGIETITLIDVIRVVNSPDFQNVKLGFRVSGGSADPYNDGLVLIENRR